MNTICPIPDIDTYLLYYLDIKTIMRLTTISKDQHILLSNITPIKEIKLINLSVNANHLNNISNLIYFAAYHGYLSLIQWIHESKHLFKYDKHAVNAAAGNGARRRLQCNCNLIRSCEKMLKHFS